MAGSVERCVVPARGVGILPASGRAGGAVCSLFVLLPTALFPRSKQLTYLRGGYSGAEDALVRRMSDHWDLCFETDTAG